MPEEIDDTSMHVPVEEVPPPTTEDDTTMHVPVEE
jgi:hypothetical protein